MRVLVGVFLVLSGVTLAVMGVRGTETLSSVAEPLRSLASLVAIPEPPSSGLAISAVVTLPAKVPKMEEPSTLAVAASAPPTAESLVHGLQRELTRVGCYEGASDGIWNASTRRAMAAFIERVNAKLPITKPDPVLLALVQGHQGLACGSCPAGHESSADGRCLPKMIVAWATTDGAAPAAVEAPPPPTASGDRRLPAGTARQKKAARGADRSPPIEGRMSIGATTVTPLGPQAAREKLAAAEPFPSGPQSAQQLRRERRATRHGRRHVAALRSRGYLRPMRPVRYAFRPFRGGLAALFFGF